VSASAQGFLLVVAADETGGIGKAGKLPWKLPAEMAFFKRLTTEASAGRQNAVIMGRKTYESIPPKFRPLRNRLNIVLSRDPSHHAEGAENVGSLDAALDLVRARNDIDRVFCVGGAEIYRIALAHEDCAGIYLTRVHAQFDCDAHLPGMRGQFRVLSQDGPHTENGLTYTFENYRRI
jgi:dihydrofolate reductase